MFRAFRLPHPRPPPPKFDLFGPQTLSFSRTRPASPHRQPNALKKCPDCSFVTDNIWLLVAHTRDSHEPQRPLNPKHCPACSFAVGRHELHRLYVHAVECHPKVVEEHKEFGKELTTYFEQFNEEHKCKYCAFGGAHQRNLEDHVELYHRKHEPEPEPKQESRDGVPKRLPSSAWGPEVVEHEEMVEEKEMMEEDEEEDLEETSDLMKYIEDDGQVMLIPRPRPLKAYKGHISDYEGPIPRSAHSPQPSSPTIPTKLIPKKQAQSLSLNLSLTAVPPTSYDYILSEGGIPSLLQSKIKSEIAAFRLHPTRNIFARNDYGHVIKALTTALCHELPGSFYGNVAFGVDVNMADQAGSVIRTMRKTKDLQTRCDPKIGVWNPWNDTFGGGSDGRGSAWICNRDRKRLKEDLLAFWTQMEQRHLCETRCPPGGDTIDGEKKDEDGDGGGRKENNAYEAARSGYYANLGQGWYGPGQIHKPRGPWQKLFDHIIAEVFGPKEKVNAPDEWQACDFFLLGFAYAVRDDYKSMREDVLREIGRIDITELSAQVFRVKDELRRRLNPSSSTSMPPSAPQDYLISKLLHESGNTINAKRMESFTPFATEHRDGAWCSKGYRLGLFSEEKERREDLKRWYQNWQMVQAREREKAEREMKEKEKGEKEKEKEEKVEEEREKERGVKRKREDEDPGHGHEWDFGCGEAF